MFTLLQLFHSQNENLESSKADFESVNEILRKCDHSNESCGAVRSCGVVWLHFFLASWNLCFSELRSHSGSWKCQRGAFGLVSTSFELNIPHSVVELYFRPEVRLSLSLSVSDSIVRKIWFTNFFVVYHSPLCKSSFESESGEFFSPRKSSIAFPSGE